MNMMAIGGLKTNAMNTRRLDDAIANGSIVSGIEVLSPQSANANRGILPSL